MDLWDGFQQHQINETMRIAKGARRDLADEGKRTRIEFVRLEAKINHLALTCQALWEVLRDQTHLTDDDVRKKMMEIDARDGNTDGRMITGPVNCPDCGREGHSRSRTCLYCGGPLSAEKHLFEP